MKGAVQGVRQLVVEGMGEAAVKQAAAELCTQHPRADSAVMEESGNFEEE